MPKGAAVKAKPKKGVRLRQPNKKQAKVLARKEAKALPSPLGSFRLSAQVFKIFSRQWRLLGGILLVYLILNVLFASGVGSINSTVTQIKDNLNSQSAQTHPLVAGSTGFLALVGSAGTINSATGSSLQAMLVILESLVIIWTLRQILAGKKVGIKESYYSATAPLVPFLLVVLLIFIQLLPITLGFSVLSAIANALGSLSALTTFMLFAVAGLFTAWSLYMVSSSVFALYIVTLPNMQPLAALRSAKNLVRFRRWMVIRRLVFLPLLILVLMGAVVIPLILYATPAVMPVFFVLTALVLLFAHSYLYSLYRGLLG